MADLLSDFLDNPAGDTFLPLREAVIAAPEYDMFSDGLNRLGDLVESSDAAGALAMAPELMPNWLLSPQVHYLLSKAAEMQLDTDRTNSEMVMFQACMHGLTSSGDGTEDQPFAVLHVSDEYAILDALDKEPSGQRREMRDGQAFDVVTCSDESELWFDITDSLAAMSGR